MKKIAIISSSVREGRMSHRAALYLSDYIQLHDGYLTDILDLKEFDFPLFPERLRFLSDPSPKTVDFARRFEESDGIVIVSPVYNGSFPASLKNVIDLLYEHWNCKPVLIVSVTYTSTPGIATIQQLQSIMLKLNALVCGPLYTIIDVANGFNETGEPVNLANASRFAKLPVRQLLWMIDRNSENPMEDI